MSDLESYLTHCYDILLQKKEEQGAAEEEECCACTALIERQDHEANS